MAGLVVWVTGLSGAGKTSVSKLVCDNLTQENPTILLDGDAIREVLAPIKSGYAKDDRRSIAMVYARLCREISSQNIDVVCSTVSMFHDVREWNRLNLERYVEVYLKVPLPELKRRDSKGYYAGGINMVGETVEAEEPLFPDIVIENHGEITIKQSASIILNHIKSKDFSK